LVYYWPEYRWRANYETDRGTPYSVDGTEIDECPVSYISGWAAEVVSSLELSRQVREATGENPLPPVHLWPVRLIDVARIISIEKIKESNARFEAEQAERS
jgi:hypothetical protein